MNARERVRFWFDDLDTPMGRAVDLVVIALILIGCALIVLETYTLGEPWDGIVVWGEWFIMGCFIVEYALRLWSAEDRVRWVSSPYAVIDLLAILPAVLAFTPHLQVFRMLRVLRVMRLLRFLEDHRFFFGTVRLHHLGILRIAFTLFAIVFIASGLVWHIEHEDPRATIRTYGDAIYFCVVTVTTVGFGDHTPQTIPGRWVTVLMIVAGVILIPWQIRDMIATGTTGTDDRSPDCPRCGLRRHRMDARYCWRCGESLTGPISRPEAER